MTSVLIRHCMGIATGLGGTAARHPGPDIRIQDGVITALGTLSALPGERTIDAQDSVVYPAWVNTHHHLFQSLLKSEPQGQNQALTQWLAATPYRFRAAFDEDIFRVAVRVGLVELALSGCGTVADHNYLYFPGQRFDPSHILFEEAAALGMRFVLCRGGATLTRQLEAELPQALRPESIEAYWRDVERLVSRHHQPQRDAMQRVVMAPTTPTFSMRPEEMRDSAALARALGIRLHSHLSETVSYQDYAHENHRLSPVALAQSLNWLGDDVWFAHLVKLDAEEIALLGQTGTGIAHCPQSNGRLGSGIAPIAELQRAGVPISIGVDGAASNEAADMISEVHCAWLMSRARAGEHSVAQFRGGQGERDIALVDALDVLRWGTAGGAAILGLPATGTIEVGQCADLALYDLSRDPRYFGHLDPLISPIVSGGSARLRSLLVGGRELVRDGQLAGVDMKLLHAQAGQAVERIKSQVQL